MLLCARAVDTLGMMPCMVILTKERICVDCCCRFVAAHGKASVRCKPCQRLFVNRETCERDKARRARQKAEASICDAIGLPQCDVLRDNRHRCQCCRRVLFLEGFESCLCLSECLRFEFPLLLLTRMVLPVWKFHFSFAYVSTLYENPLRLSNLVTLSNLSSSPVLCEITNTLVSFMT